MYLSNQDLSEIAQALSTFQIVGDRYPEEIEQGTNI